MLTAFPAPASPQSAAGRGTDSLAALADRTGIFVGVDAACQSSGPLSFASPNTASVPSQSGVSVRFQLLDPCGRPLPFLCPSQFSAQAGSQGRHIGNGPHDEGAISVGGVRLRAVDASAQYITLLVDGSMSMDEDERTQVLSAFVDSYGGGSGATYMRILAFQGHTSRLLLTSECPAGFCDDIDTLHRAITEMQTSLDNWEDADGFSAVYHAISDTVDELGVLMRAHADMQPQDVRAVRTSDSLVIFTDLDDNSNRATLEATLATIDAIHPSVGSISMVIFEPHLDERDVLTVGAKIEAAKQRISATLGAEFVVDAVDASQLQVAFQHVADTVNAEANSWYEIFVCPPQRVGEKQELVISVEGYDGSLTTTFDATGFSNTCPFDFQSGDQALELLTRTEFCDERGCGFYDGVFCGLCDGPLALGSSYTIHEEHESLLLRYAQGGTRPTAIGFVSNLGSVHITAHVGIEHQLVKCGENFGGVTVESDGVSFDANANQHPILVHVTPPADVSDDDGEHSVWSTDKLSFDTCPRPSSLSSRSPSPSLVREPFDCCSGTEPTVYATVALVSIGLACQIAAQAYPARKEVNDAFYFLLFGPMLAPLFCVNAGCWIVCKAQDSSVEGVYSVIMLVVAGLQTVYYCWVKKEEEDDLIVARIATIFVCITFVIFSAALFQVDAVVVRDIPFLSSCNADADVTSSLGHHAVLHAFQVGAIMLLCMPGCATVTYHLMKFIRDVWARRDDDDDDDDDDDADE
eukprot:COSAG02_NODE_4729_length_5044_cov_2.301517_4_plen_751_part_00